MLRSRRMFARCSSILMWLMALLLALPPVAVASGSASTRKWVHIETIPGGTACAVRHRGSEVDTMMMLNRSGQLVLIAGRSGWHGAGSETIAMRVDRGPIDRIKADAFNNLVMVRISSLATLKRLERAKNLLWYMPTGEYHTEVAGLDGALKWLYRCEAKKRLQRR